jgi:hypothetical protein
MKRATQKRLARKAKTQRIIFTIKSEVMAFFEVVSLFLNKNNF